MKTQLFIVLASAATLFSTNANASSFQKTEFKPVTHFVADFNEGEKDNVTYLGETTVKITAETKVINVNLGDVKNDEITIRIEDSKGTELLTEKVKGAQKFAKKYNVSKLEDGSYNMIIAKKTVRTTQPFVISNNKVTISDIEKKEKFIPVLNMKGDKLDVNVLLGNYSNTVTLYDNEGRKVFNEKNYVVVDLHKRYDLSQLVAGVYVAEVKAGDETFYYTIKK
jgi:hypothetical protein